ncbi:hypothetical protein DT73_00575 [Mangrovibacter sp. MFB070]|nr:hypothetical protein DT73_00575 [Mangrovibacter sp. MFB070]
MVFNAFLVKDIQQFLMDVSFFVLLVIEAIHRTHSIHTTVAIASFCRDIHFTILVFTDNGNALTVTVIPAPAVFLPFPGGEWLCNTFQITDPGCITIG